MGGRLWLQMSETRKDSGVLESEQLRSEKKVEIPQQDVTCGYGLLFRLAPGSENDRTLVGGGDSGTLSAHGVLMRWGEAGSFPRWRKQACSL